MAIQNNTQNITSLLVNGSELSSLLASLAARQDSITTALSSDAKDYDFNAELIDAHTDAFGNSHELIGNNIRENQLYLFNLIREEKNTRQTQYDLLADAIMKLTAALNSLLTGDDINNE